MYTQMVEGVRGINSQRKSPSRRTISQVSDMNFVGGTGGTIDDGRFQGSRTMIDSFLDKPIRVNHATAWFVIYDTILQRVVFNF